MKTAKDEAVLGALILILGAGALWLTFIGVVVFVIYHFITKFW